MTSVAPAIDPARATPRARPRSNSTPMIRTPGPVRVAAALVLLAGCTASSEEVRPPDDELFFPTGIAVSPDETLLFVASANSDLRYDSGVVSVVDLPTVDRDVDRLLAGQDRDEADCKPSDTCPTCGPELGVFRGTVRCHERRYLLSNASVRTGNFSTDLGVQDTGVGNLRLILPVRGDPSITWIDWNGADRRLDCEGGAGGFALCDDDHRLNRLLDNKELPAVVEEPYEVYVDSDGEYAMVTHLTTGVVSLVDSPRAGKPVLADALSGLFATQFDIGQATAIAGRSPALPGTLVYVGGRGRDQNRIQVFSVDRGSRARPVMVPTFFFHLTGLGATSSTDTRAITFNTAGDRMFVVNRLPPSLQVYDTSLDTTGLPRNRIVGATDLCREASRVVLADTGDGERAYVSCFSDGQVWVIDPRAGVQLEAIIQVGRGPHEMAVSTTHRKLYVSNFLEDTIAVVDLTPGVPSRNHVVLRIGEPRE